MLLTVRYHANNLDAAFALEKYLCRGLGCDVVKIELGEFTYRVDPETFEDVELYRLFLAVISAGCEVNYEHEKA